MQGLKKKEEREGSTNDHFMQVERAPQGSGACAAAAITLSDRALSCPAVWLHKNALFPFLLPGIKISERTTLRLHKGLITDIQLCKCR